MARLLVFVKLVTACAAAADMADYSTYFNSSGETITLNQNCSFWEVYNDVTAKCECVNNH